ncbi:MAG: protein-L-isoaspartate(D-aspartate) O-methyltransferase [Syntrophus sp. (in: bacteria)]|nr:protein-L-isoaspartate(D-aspartate) O-methyltransferase [Syntrophus sp. (in: bacteria)]
MKLFLFAAALLFFCGALPVQGSEFEAERKKMVREVMADAALTALYVGSSAISPSVIKAMEKVERHRFVPSGLVPLAYLNRPLPIGHGQTISQPYIVALMTDLMKVKPGDRVLEIGTGSGYQAAILAELAGSVYSIEIIEALGREAATRLKALGFRNVKAKVGDGYYGWPEAAPFDSIMVTAAASHVPPPLVRQLKRGGRMVIPMGTQFLTQSLMLVEKKQDGSIISRQILPVRFVPLTGGHQ